MFDGPDLLLKGDLRNPYLISEYRWVSQTSCCCSDVEGEVG